MHRDAGLILAGLILAVIFGALLANQARPQDAVMPEPQPAAVAFSVIAEGDRAKEITERVNYRIRTEPEFLELWEAVHADETPAPLVDFEAHDVLAVFDGERPRAGYDISIVGVEQTEEGELKVTILHEEPGASCVSAEVITSPFELVVVPKVEAPVTREDLVKIKECE